MLKPAGPGTGVIAGGGVRAIMEAAGVRNVLTKSLGSNNVINVVRATIKALGELRDPRAVRRERLITAGKIQPEPEQTEAEADASDAAADAAAAAAATPAESAAPAAAEASPAATAVATPEATPEATPAAKPPADAEAPPQPAASDDAPTAG